MSRLPALLALAVLAACAERGTGRLDAVAPPLDLAADVSAYELAGRVELPSVTPLDELGLHHVFRLSDQIVSGAEPDGEQALQAIAAMGVKTILSVDGKAPDAATAERLGLRYVHVPIQYRGMTDDELLAIAKTFRELPGPFYVHCFHGQHRGPAAAAVGRLLLDGVSRQQAAAEMRQYCGTSPKYEGLYRQITSGELPSAEQTEAHAFAFPATHEPSGVTQLMVGMARAFDNVEAMATNAWQPPVDHPDIDPANEGAILLGLLERGRNLPEFAGGDPDFVAMLEATLTATHELRAAVQASPEGDWSAADRAFASLKASCSACHAAFRND